jgi:16S rRNA (uracil1498-N3)-methyltransferase
MADFRVYAPAAQADAREIRLDGAESHHLVVVNRCRRGDPVIAFDGRGREWECTCLDPAKSEAVLTVQRTRQAPSLPRITLAQSLPKGATMDEIIRHATELGASRIVPLLTERTQVHLDSDRADRKIEKWRTVAIEAAKQCGNPWVPEITPVRTLETLLRRITAPANVSGSSGNANEQDLRFDLKLVASLHAGTRTLREVLQPYRAHHQESPRTALWLVGPEGDFSPVEMTSIITAGCSPVTLGPLVLRCDTAAVAALSVLGYELSNP